jgi:nuclear protein localization family protein 4
MILEGIPKSEPQPDVGTVRLSNQPSSSGESVSLEALQGRTVGDMGFRWVRPFTSQADLCS